MAFEPEPLTDDIQFTEDDKNKDVMVAEGKGQWVYWKDCIGVSYKENGENKIHNMNSGRVILQSGIQVYFAKGYVKEG